LFAHNDVILIDIVMAIREIGFRVIGDAKISAGRQQRITQIPVADHKQENTDGNH
jgi:hypothetical protein